MCFAKKELPPLNAFWLVGIYDKGGFQVANPLNQFAIGDREELKYNADGSLNLCLQYESPGADKESNCSPVSSTR